MKMNNKITVGRFVILLALLVLISLCLGVVCLLSIV